jgi:hypothetical protein
MLRSTADHVRHDTMKPIRSQLRFPNPKTLQVIAAIFVALLGAAVLQKTAGILFHKEIEIGVLSSQQHRRRFSPRENHFAGLIPESYRTDLVMARGILLEDGMALQHRRLSIGALSGTLGSNYALTQKYVHFQSSDGSDPNDNGKRYTLRVPQRVKPGLLWGLFGALVLTSHLAFRSGPPLTSPSPLDGHSRFRSRPWLEGATVLVLSLAGGVVALVRFAHYSDGGLCVLGKPYSDAIGWHQVALFLREGLGFTASYSDNRPFYPIFQAMVFLFTGPSVAAAQCTNVLLLAMGGIFVYATARELFSRPVAFCALAFVLTAENYQHMAPMLITEIPAYAFGAAGVFLLACGCSPEKRNHRTWLLFLAGVFLGCSNLARPHTLLALPLCGLVILLAGLSGRWGWRPILLRGVLFGVGIVVVFLPWVAREKRVHDVWGISLNSSEMLYATASTQGGKWNKEEFDEAAADGYTKDDPAALHKYFGRRLAESVRTDPGAYAATIGRGFVDFFRALTIEKPLILAILALATLATLFTGAWAARSALPLLAAPVFWYLGSWADGWRGYELVPLALLVLLLAERKRARNAVLMAALFLAGTGLLSAMVGNFGLHRGEPIIEWIFVMIFVAATLSLARLCCRWGAGKTSTPAQIASVPPRGSVFLANAVFGFMLMAGSALLVCNLTASPPENEITHLDESTRRQATSAAAARVPELVSADPALVFAELVTIDDYRWEIPAGMDVGHWSRLFERRNQSRTTAYVHEGPRPRRGAGMIGAHFRGSLESVEKRRPYILVGLRNQLPHPPMDHDGLIIEALALVPCDSSGRNLDPDAVLPFPPSHEALALITSLKAED